MLEAIPEGENEEGKIKQADSLKSVRQRHY